MSPSTEAAVVARLIAILGELERINRATDEVAALVAKLDAALSTPVQHAPAPAPDPRDATPSSPALHVASRRLPVPETVFAELLATDAPVDLATVRRHRDRRRAGTAALSLVGVAGLLMVADAVASMTWQEPISKLRADHAQAKLAPQLASLDRSVMATAPPLTPTPAAPSAPVGFTTQAARLQRRVRQGDAIGRIRIPKLGSTTILVQGTGEEQLKEGPGHYGSTALPGQPGTVAIAGHRTTYGAPFRHIDRLVAGDRIVLRMPYGAFTYRVEGSRVVLPSQTSVLRSSGRSQLVLTACTPLYSAAKRLVVTARLIRATD